MRKHVVGIPIVLWICAAAWFHTMLGGGGYELAVLHDDGNFLSAFSSKVRDRVRDSETTIEFDMGDESPSPAPPDEEAPPPEAVKPPTPDQEKQPKEPKPDEKKKPEEKKKDEPKVAVPVQPAPPPPQPQKDQRIAVKQHVKPDQDDNQAAKFIADDANKVDEEKVATQTAHDEDDEHPAPGGNHSGPNDEVGNADKTKVANSEEHAGEKNKAPGEKGTVNEIDKPAAAKAPKAPVAAQTPPAGGDGRTAATPAKAPKVEQPTPTPPSGADVPSSPTGGWSFNPFRGPAKNGAENDKSAQGKTGRKVEAPDNPSTTKWLGLGGSPGPGQINLNLSHTSVVATVGEDKLRKERTADGERRLTAHRGSWRSSNFDRWRSAIENYVTSVKPGNQTALNAARVPFATYLNTIHNRIHPIFAESFLDSLSGLPANHPLNNKNMHTNLEIVLTKDGKIVKMGITRTSGVTAFDIAALDSVERASPFGPAPGAILSSDGNVYLHWEFHRDEVFACSTMNARPFMLNLPGKEGTPEMPPAGPKPTEGAAPAGARHGFLGGPRTY